MSTMCKGELDKLNERTTPVDRLQRVCSELAELHKELTESKIEPNALGLLRDTVDQMRKTAGILRQGIERSRVSEDKQDLRALLIDERMRLAAYLNTGISADLEAGRIRTDQDGLSGYLRVLNQAIEQLDLVFESRKP
jgi:hypothetical protein